MKIRIVVCLKQVGYIYHPIGIDAPGGTIDREKMVYLLNPYDEFALEESLKIKESFPGSEVILITVGPPRTAETLRYAFSFGADKMIRVQCENLDVWSTALLLAEVIRKLKFDLILCGKKAIDTNGGQVGSFVAECLKIPQVSGIVGLELSPQGGKAIVERYLGKGDREVVECDLPALFTVERSMNDPRYPTVRNRLLAERLEVEEINAKSLNINMDPGMSLSKCMRLSPPRPKPKKVFTPDSRLSARERMQFIMSGGMAGKNSDLFEGPPEEMADKIMEVLIQEKIL